MTDKIIKWELLEVEALSQKYKQNYKDSLELYKTIKLKNKGV